MQYIFYVTFKATEAAIRCSSYEEDVLLDGYLRLNDVTGINDNAHPDLEITNIVIKRDKIVYYVICEEIEESIDDDLLEDLEEDSEEPEEKAIGTKKTRKRRGRI